MRFVKLNFGYSARDVKDGADFVIRDPDSRLLATRHSSLFETLIPGVELCAWIGIFCTRHVLQVEMILVKDDSATVIGWIQDETKTVEAYPFLYDIGRLLRLFIMTSVCHIY